MSLQTDAIFVKALRSNSALLDLLPAGDVYNTAIALPEEQALNAPLPYVIVSFDGLNAQDGTKDNCYRSVSDQVSIGVEVAADTREQLASLAIEVRVTFEGYFQDHAGTGDDDDDLIPYSMSLHAEKVQYDSLKPCYWQSMTYECDTNPD